MADVALLLAHPALPLLAAAVVVGLLPRRFGAVGAIIGVLASAAALALVVGLPTGDGPQLRAAGFVLEPLRVDGLSRAFAIVFTVALGLGLVYGAQTAGRRERSATLVYAAAAIGVVLAGDLLTLFWAWEAKALASTVVVLANPTRRAAGAGVRYLYTHLAGGSALLAGITWHAATTGSLAFTAFEAGVPAVLIGLGFALSAAVPPLHAWLPDAYPKASVPGAVVLSAFTTKAAVYALARGFPGFELLLWVGVAMALYGVAYAMLQDDIRALLAYHIVSQVGFMVAAVGIGTADAINGAAAHAFAHILYKGLLLMGVGAVLHATGRSLGSQLGGLRRVLPWALVLYLVGAASISGVPGFSGFVSKELVIHAAEEEGMSLVVLLLKIASVGTFLSTALKLPSVTWFGSASASEDAAHVRRTVPWTMYAAMGLAAALNVVLGLQPALLWDLLPATNTYTPFTPHKLVETTQLLVLTGAGFWLLKSQLSPKPGTMLDVDRLYRSLPAQVASWTDGLGRRRRPRVAQAGLQALAAVDQRRQRVLASEAVPQTWVLGVVVCLTSALLLLASLAR